MIPELPGFLERPAFCGPVILAMMEERLFHLSLIESRKGVDIEKEGGKYFRTLPLEDFRNASHLYISINPSDLPEFAELLDFGQKSAEAIVFHGYLFLLALRCCFLLLFPIFFRHFL